MLPACCKGSGWATGRLGAVETELTPTAGACRNCCGMVPATGGGGRAPHHLPHDQLPARRGGARLGSTVPAGPDERGQRTTCPTQHA